VQQWPVLAAAVLARQPGLTECPFGVGWYYSRTSLEVGMAAWPGADLGEPGLVMPRQPGVDDGGGSLASVALADPHRDMGRFQGLVHDTGQGITDRI
jgi:hypothetical protein